MFQKVFPLKESSPLPDVQAPSNPAINFATAFSLDLASKGPQKRWNQADFGYFDPYLNKTHGKGKIVSVGKDIYYKNVVLFVQYFQNLVTFKGVALVKTNIIISFWGSILE